jgi:TonB family protein
MTRVGLGCALSLSLLVGPPTRGVTAEAAFVPLTRWEADLGGAKTEATPEMLVLRAGTIRTRALYSDFILRFDYRVPTPKGGATLLIRARFDYGRSVRGFTIALDDGRERGRLSTEAQSLHALPVDARALASPSGRWTHCEVRAEGDALTVSVDGTIVSRADRLNEFAGHIGFTSRGSDGIELRNVALASLEPPDDAFPTGVPAADTPGVHPPQIGPHEPAFYPVSAFDQKITGTVHLDVVIGTDGRIVATRVKDAPHPDLAVAALGCVRKWRFTPAMKDGVPLAVTASVDVGFALTQ